MMPTDAADSSEPRDLSWIRITSRGIAVLVLVILSLWLAVTVVAYVVAGSDVDESARIGDTFGAVNALFSGLALAGVVLAILLQRQELQLQRDELKLTREELARTATAQEHSHDALNLQAESLLLAAYINAIDSLQKASTRQSDVVAGPAGEYISTLEMILRKLEPRIEYLSGRSSPEELAHRIDRTRAGIVSRVKERARRLELALEHFDCSADSIVALKPKIVDLQSAIEDVHTTTDDRIRDSLNLSLLFWPVDEINRLLRKPGEFVDDEQGRWAFQAAIQGVVSHVNSWVISNKG